MSRRLAITLALTVFLPPLVAGPPTVPADLRRQMPKDQVEFVEKMEKLQTLAADAAKQKTGLRKEEADEKLRLAKDELLAAFMKRMETDGVKDWVVVCGKPTPDALPVEVPSAVALILKYDGMPEAVRGPIRDAKAGTVLKITILPNALNGASRIGTQRIGLGPNHVLTATFDGSDLKDVEKVKK